MSPEVASLVTTYGLAENEIKILKLSALDCTHKQIAAHLNITEKMVEKSAERIGKKLGGTCNHMQFKAFGEWILTGNRPSLQAYGISWKCPDPPRGCGANRPIERFPGLPVDIRCEDCIREHATHRISQAKSSRIKNMVKLMVEEAGTKAAPDLPNINAVLSEFMEQDGGFHNFVKQWQYQLQEARTKAPGAKFVLDAHRDMLRLVIAAMQAQANTTELANLTDEQGREFIMRLLMEHMARKGVQELVELYTEESDAEANEEHPIADAG